MTANGLVDLPPELLDRIIEYFDTARSVAHLGATNKTLQAFVEKEAWRTFVTCRFPSLIPKDATLYKDAARTLTTLSKAWGRRAFVARYTEPQGNIYALPQGHKIERWRKPRGQTLGFVPQLDCFEDIGSSWFSRSETFAFTAGAEICLRQRDTRDNGSPDVRWTVYRSFNAVEGRDDVTSLHLLRPTSNDTQVQIIAGTANGDLQLLKSSAGEDCNIIQSRFETDGQPVRSSTVLQGPGTPTLLASNVGDTRIVLFKVDPMQTRIAPSDSIHIKPLANGHRSYRAWSTKFLSSRFLAVGLGPSTHPVQIYNLTSSGIEKDTARSFSLQNNVDHRVDEAESPSLAKKPSSSIYPIVTLQQAVTGGNDHIFLSGAYDGVIRLHDLRSPRDVEQIYIDPTDDSAIYSLLLRGQETVVAGTSRHSLLKVFDLRLGAKAYSYLDANPSSAGSGNASTQRDWNLFLKPHGATYPGRGGGNNWARRSAESSVYSLASSGPCSPFIYAGVENAVLELAFTSVLDRHPDPSVVVEGSNWPSKDVVRGFRTKEILDLSMYDQTDQMVKLKTQRSLWETFRWKTVHGHQHAQGMNADHLAGLDERWRIA